MKEPLKSFSNKLIYLMGVWLFAVPVWADGRLGGENSCQAIATHNPFDLKSPPSAVPAASTPLPEITLNGITTIFGDKRALFKVQPPSPAKEQAYFLSEGERVGALELLSVDVKGGKIKISNNGIIRVIALCPTPRLDCPALAVSFAGTMGAADGSGNQGNPSTGTPSAGQGTPGMAGGQFYGQAYAASQGNSGTPANEGSGSGAQVADGTGTQNGSPTGETQKSEPYAIRAARDFEQTRIQTADAVRNGLADPLPLTPLTPPGTPAELVGPGRAWFAAD